MTTTHIDDDDTTTRDPDPDHAITRRQAAELLGVSPVTLDQWRYRGEGPRFFRAGARAIRYRLGDVLAWRDARMAGSEP